MSARFDLIVVGAGHNGLVLGAYLAKAGLKILLLERRLEIGGGLCTEEVTIPGYRHNLHSIYHMMTDVMPPFRDFDLARHGVQYARPNVQIAMPFSDGRCLVVHRDAEKTCNSIARFSERDASAYRRMHEEYSRLMDELLIPATYLPPVPPLDHAALMQETEVGRAVLELTEKSPMETVCDRFEESHVRTLMLYLACMWGLRHDAGGVGYMVPLYLNRASNYSLCVGGSHRLSSAFSKIILQNGGTILDNEEVTRVMVKDGAAVGVETAGGKSFEARAVASTLDPPQTFLSLVGEENLDADLVGTVKNWKWEEWSLFNIHLALKEPPRYSAASFDPHINDAFICVAGYESPDDLLSHWSSVEKGELSGRPAANCSTPTLFDPTQAPTGRHTGFWSAFAPYRLRDGGAEGWDRVRDEYTKRCLESWRNYAPNMSRENILGTYPYTPLDIERKLTDMREGSIKQGSYISLQMGYFRPNDQCSQYRTPIRGLYICGSGCYPGGMITGGPGYNAACVIAEDLNIKPWWTPPEYISLARAKGLV